MYNADDDNDDDDDDDDDNDDDDDDLERAEGRDTCVTCYLFSPFFYFFKPFP